MLSQFFILTPRGDSIIMRDFRGDLPKGTADIFFRHVKFWKGKHEDAPPVFNLDGINYFYLRQGGLFLAATSIQNVSPSLMMELLYRLSKLFKDYCGTLNEESIRKNFVLIYELLDEVLDYGYPQVTSTEQLKAYVYNSPVVVEKQRLLSSFGMSDLNRKTTPSSSVDKPISVIRQKGRKKKRVNEIFVDIYERISVVFNSNGYALSSSIDGTIQMKSYLAGNPELRLALNEDLVIGKSNVTGSGGYGNVVLDDCNFHECVRLEEFDATRTLSFQPPDGEFSVLNYRVTGEFRAPFRIFPFFELVTPYKIELIIKIRADVPEQNYGGNVLVQFPVPKATTSVSCDLGLGTIGQASEYSAVDKKVFWKIKKFGGGTEQTLRVKITLGSQHTTIVRKEIGPISMTFEIPMFNASGLQVRYLRIMESRKSYNPYRWVRYVSRSSSYVCRL
uniref:AP-4 complex subunit mu-1 n=1 Tax=Hirondellea gigas TaxID=1518452 RepID=A0A6A7GCG2_9CRUS